MELTNDTWWRGTRSTRYLIISRSVRCGVISDFLMPEAQKSVYFSLLAGNSPEKSSQETAPTASQSRIFSLVPKMLAETLMFGHGHMEFAKRACSLSSDSPRNVQTDRHILPRQSRGALPYCSCRNRS